MCEARSPRDEDEKIGRMDLTMFESKGTGWKRKDISLLQRSSGSRTLKSNSGASDSWGPARLSNAHRENRSFFLSGRVCPLDDWCECPRMAGNVGLVSRRIAEGECQPYQDLRYQEPECLGIPAGILGAI